MKIGGYEVAPTAKAILKDVTGDDITGLGAEVAYHLFFSIIPLLIFLTALIGVVSQAIGINNVMTDVTDWLFNQSGMPRETAAVLEAPIEQALASETGGILSVGALLALWGAKNAVSALMKALNVAFDVEEGRPWLIKTLISIGLTIALGFGVAIASAVLLAGGLVGQGISGLFGLGAAWETVWGVLRFVLVPLALVVALAFLYWAGPNVKAPMKWLTPGAVISVVLWVVATVGLGFYFQYAAGYVSAYGVLGAVLAFLFWLYVMSVILLFGGSINSVLLKLNGEAAVPRWPKKTEPGESADVARAHAKGQPVAPAAGETGASPAARADGRAAKLRGGAKAAGIAGILTAVASLGGHRRSDP